MVIDDEEIRRCDGFEAFNDAVQREDDVFRSIATVQYPIEGGGDWWVAVVPGYGGAEFASDLLRERGIAIEVRE
ncbi:hypothetical protein [Actinoplanes subglobosus]|uniref:Uncharacterized protein n=1 Tax=Actinoplanes subglobosus TaxID=1547892 RepID=A0ABV8IQQ5_9ACTN